MGSTRSLISPKWLLAAWSLSLAGCGSATDSGLFAGGTGSGSGGFNLGFGGTFVTGGTFSAGGMQQGTGGVFGAGGFAPGSGGRDQPGSGGSPIGDAGSNPTGCDFAGTWASYIIAPVTWPATSIVLLAGQGNIQQWNLSHQTMHGRDVSAATIPCGIFLPDLVSTSILGGAKFGIRFPESLFDAGDVPTTTFVLKGSIGSSGKYQFQTDPFAIVLGLNLADPTTAPWPAPANMQLVDHDLDSKPGITVVAAPGQGYSFPPTDLAGNTADLIFIAERTVSSLAGEVINCNEVHAVVTILPVNGGPGINSTVIGCRKAQTGADCVAADAQFIDSNRPQFTPSSTGTMVSVRLPDGAGCPDVRARFPKQQ